MEKKRGLIAERHHLEYLSEAPTKVVRLAPIGLGSARRAMIRLALIQSLATDVDRGSIRPSRQIERAVVEKDAPVDPCEDFLRGGDGVLSVAQEPPHEVVNGSAVQLEIAREGLAFAAPQPVKKQVRVDLPCPCSQSGAYWWVHRM